MDGYRVKRRPLPSSFESHSDRVSAISSNDATIWSPNFDGPENEPFIHSPASGITGASPLESKDATISTLKVSALDITSTTYETLSHTPVKESPYAIDQTLVSHDWIPYTLRLSYLLILGIISTALAVIIILLTWLSWSRSGLGDDNGSSILLFGWRFTPTLVAVLFVILETLLLEDVRRTEVFARLSSPCPGNAATTVLATSRSWWNDPIDALSRKKNGGLLSQTLFYAAIMNIVGSFVLSPLSAAFLSSELTPMSERSTFRTFQSIQNATLPISPDDETYFKTVSALVLNLSTSVWLTDNHTITPFWTSTLSEAPLGATVPETPQNWTANTPVLQVQLDCMPMTLNNLAQTSFQLSSEDGCTVGVEVAVGAAPTPNPLESAPTYTESLPTYYPIKEAGAWWVSTAISASDFSTSMMTSQYNQTSLTNVSQECQGRYILGINTPFNVTYSNEDYYINGTTIITNTTGFRLRSYLCNTNYFSANLSVDVAVSSLNTSLGLNEKLFNKSTSTVPSAHLNFTMFDDAFFSNYWMDKLNVSGQGRSYVGPALPLAAMYGYDVDAMLDDQEIVMKAQQVAQRFFGESVLAAYGKSTPVTSPSLLGSTTKSKQRIVASFGIGATLAVILLGTSILTALVFYHSRLSRRPLNLDRDPGPAAAVTSLLKLEATSSHFRGLDRLPDVLIRKKLEALTFALDRGSLMVDDRGMEQDSSKAFPPPPAKAYSKDWRPFVLKGWGGLSLILALASLITALSVLFAKSRIPGLYETGLVYSHSITFKNLYVTSLAPYSIIPTLVAVGVRFWWRGLESTFKRVQPYVSMAKRPVALSAGPALSYNTLPPVYSVWKAARHRHWLLAFVCIGAALVDVFTVSMSALWQRNIGSRQSNVELPRTLMLRDVPQVFNVPVPDDPDSGDPEDYSILSQLYGDSEVFLSWMYGAVNELSYAGANLPWTQSDWSFTPINVSSSSVTTPSASDASIPNESANITLETFGLRGRLECQPVDMRNVSNWLYTWDLTNSSVWNLSSVDDTARKYKKGYELGSFFGGEVETYFWLSSDTNTSTGSASTFFSNPSRVQCCANETDGEPGLTALGYWAPLGVAEDLILSHPGHGAQDETVDGRGSLSRNITVKWVVGKPFPWQWTQVNQTSGPFLWSEIPEVNVLTCQPVIESSRAEVTVKQEDESVVDFELLEQPEAHQPAWSDYYLKHNTTPGANGTVQPLGLYHVGWTVNITVSYGYLFMDAMLGAADSQRFVSTSRWGYEDEPLHDRMYSIKMPGLNADLMSYAIWTSLNGNISALLDPSILETSASSVFTTFFQHFVAENSASGGGRAYQLLNYSLPGDLGPIVNADLKGISAYQDSNSSANVSNVVRATLSKPAYRLDMSIAAVAICLGILVCLAFITVVIFLVDHNYFKTLPRDVDSLASVLALVYDSPKLRAMVEQNQLLAENAKGSGYTQPGSEDTKAVIGYFQGSHGDTRWGIELVDGLDGGKRASQGADSFSDGHELLSMRR
ncbi:uncharacterized protein PAC_18560 [Phialocephala subalpina]|uniref:Uncharacterized protein n=1 Tax=Phialocephala subalpina TaxID=576137 RepID=A0A1L7XUF2_9HELO|nr:uncharacterized protein PAC_18560 [Phialocephala subalpina]